MQRFPTVADYEATRANYCEDIVTREALVEDAITGNSLLIKDQLIFMSAHIVADGCNPPEFMTVRDVPQLVRLLRKRQKPSPRRHSSKQSCSRTRHLRREPAAA